MKNAAYVYIHPNLTEWFVAMCLLQRVGTVWHVKSLITPLHTTPMSMFVTSA